MGAEGRRGQQLGRGGGLRHGRASSVLARQRRQRCLELRHGCWQASTKWWSAAWAGCRLPLPLPCRRCRRWSVCGRTALLLGASNARRSCAWARCGGQEAAGAGGRANWRRQRFFGAAGVLKSRRSLISGCDCAEHQQCLLFARRSMPAHARGLQPRRVASPKGCCRSHQCSGRPRGKPTAYSQRSLLSRTAHSLSPGACRSQRVYSNPI